MDRKTYIRTLEDFQRIVLPGPNGNGGEESLFLDFKSTPPEVRKIAISIAAFANSMGGVLVLGVEEDPARPKFAGRVCGVDDVESTVRRVEEALSAWTFGFEE